MSELPFEPYDFFGYIASGLVLVVVAQETLGFPKVFGADLKPFDIAVTVLAVYIAGQLVAGPSKFLFEDLLVHRVLRSPTTNLLASSPPRLRTLLFPGFYEPLPPLIRTRIVAKLESMALADADAEDIFLTIRYAPEVLGSERLIAKIDAFRDMYGFNRNVSFSLLLAALCFATAGHLKGSRSLVHFAIAALIAGTLLFYRYLKFFRQYSYELFNSYAGMSEKGNS
jgi:hypothetical protein